MEKRKRLLQNPLVLQEALVSLMISSNYLGMEAIPQTMVFKIWDYYPIFHYSNTLAKQINKMKSSVDEIKIKSTYKIIDFNDKRYFSIEKTIH
jgi:hypothetical protein